MKAPVKSALTPRQILLILLIVPAATFGLLTLINPDTLTLFLWLAVVPLVRLTWKTVRAFCGMLF
ncbi:MAG: hypothetical protein J0652_10975 [Desulfobulbaceae bacterium]|jgi:hypothetical protein|nr:hypothetical protein [Desulfobulbaceae bacterium]